MENKIIFNNLSNSTATKLATLKGRGIISIDCGNGASIIELLTNNKYYCLGEKLPSNVKIYYKNYEYIIVRESGASATAITIGTLSKNQASSVCYNDYEENVDLTSYTEVTKTNPDLLYKHEESVSLITGGTTTEYISRLPRNQYQAQNSMIIISCRDANGTTGSAIYMLSRANTNTISDFTVTSISAVGNMATFNITGTNNGFSITASAGYRYYITEISCL